MSEKKHNNGVADRELATDARNAIKWLTTIPQERIQITVHKGHLDLRGWVDSAHQRNVIEGVLRDLNGVQNLTNFLGVRALPEFAEVSAVI